MSADFIHLNLHTEYSIVDGIVRINELMSVCGKAAMPAVALTDQSNLFALVKFYQAALTAGVKPIIGVDIWLYDDIGVAGALGESVAASRRAGGGVGKAALRSLAHAHAKTQPFKAVLLAQDEAGYQNIIRLITRSYLEGQSDGKPQVSRSWLEECSVGVIALSGAVYGDIGQALLLQRDASVVQNLLEWWQKFFPERFYLEVQRTGRVGEEEYIAAALELAEKHDLPLVATNAVCFLSPSDFDAHEARVCINSGCVLDDSKRPRFYSEQQYLRTPEEMCELFADIPEALANTVEIAKRCNVAIALGENFLPIFPVAVDTTVEQHLAEEARAGLVTRFPHPQQEQSEKFAAYQQRLQYELGVINQTGFAGYFLIVADFINWAKQNGVPVGPGRGSGAGSLVAYVLGITDLDPIVHDLLFERFLNPERVSLPDFDIDFCMEGRDRVIDYVVQRYGRDKVAQIITYGTMAARAAVRDVGRVLGYPYGFVDKIAKLIPFEIGISLDKALEDEELLQQRYDAEEEVKTLIDLAKKLEGIVRNAGKHAAGVVIAPSLLTDFMPLYREADDVGGAVVTQLDMNDVAAVGLVKFDFLGLRTLTIIDWAVRVINAKRARCHESPLDIIALPLDDAATYQLLQNCATTAVFQLESRGMGELVKKLKPDCFDDIVALVALYRPGPLQSGMVDDFLDRKHGRERVVYLHPALEPILRATQGVILYQEQVMQIAQVLAGYSLGSADLLRRAMGKKKPEEMANQRAVFLEGAMKQGVDKHVANTIFDLMEKFAGYGFNKSHSAAYALIAYQTAWLKAHYPAEFMAAVLSADMDNTDKVVQLIQECENLGLTVEPPDVNAGEYQFTVKNGLAIAEVDVEAKGENDNSESDVKEKPGVIVYGLGAVKGAGQAAIENICASRAEKGMFRSLFDFCKRVDTRKVNRRVLDALIYAGAFDKIAPNRATLFASLPLALQFAEQAQRSKATGQMDLFAMLEDAEEGEEYGSVDAGNYVVVDEWPEEQKLQHEKSVLGYYLSGHPITAYKADLQKLVSSNIAELMPETNKTVVIAGFVVGVRLFNTKKGNRLAVVDLEDDTGSIALTVFSELYAKVRERLQEGQLVVVDAEIGIDNFSGSVRARALEVRTLEGARMAYAKYLLLRVEEESLDDDVIALLERALAGHRSNGSNVGGGNVGEACPLYILYKRRGNGSSSGNLAVAANNVSVQLKLGAVWQVQLKDSLMCALYDIMPRENVCVYY